MSGNKTIMQIKNLLSERTDRLQIGIAWAIYFFVNVLFCVKYNPFEIIHPLYLIVGYPLVVIGIYKFSAYIRIQQKNYFFLIAACLILLFTLFLWQPFHFPFHLLGDTAYGQWFCLIVFFVALFQWRTQMNIGGFIILQALSPGFWREIAVRSDLLCNMLLLFVFLTAQFYYSDFWNKHKILTGAIVGLFLCTNRLAAIPLVLYFFPKFLKFNTKEKIRFALPAIACFFLPFLPFLLGELGILKPSENPFILQMCQGNNWQTCRGNVWIFAAGGILLLGASFLWKRMNDLYFPAGLFLFAFVVMVGLRIGLKNGLHSAIFDDAGFDKSYFNACLPFFLFLIHETKKKTFDYSRYHIDY